MSYHADSPLTMIADGTRTDPWLAPEFAPETEHPLLEPGEFVVHAVYAGHVTLEVRGSGDTGWTTAWSPPKQATVVVTDRRTVLGCRTFDRGSTYVGFGFGALVAAGATTVSRARARRATAGQCLAMQWRHEWASAVANICGAAGWQGGLARLVGLPTEQVAVIAGRSGVRWRLMFGTPSDPNARNHATAVASAIVAARLERAASLDPAELAALRRLAEDVRLDGGPGESGALRIPGAKTIGWRPEATPGAVVREAPRPAPGGPRFCRNPACDALAVPTTLDSCDLCGRSTDAPRLRWSETAPRRPSVPRRDGSLRCSNEGCDAFGLATPLPECDLCGRSTA